MAECSESTGTIWPGRTVACPTRGPPTTRDSLLARASVAPDRSAARVGARPIEPVTPLRTTSSSPAMEAIADIADGPETISGSRPTPPGLRAGSATAPAESAVKGPASARAEDESSAEGRAAPHASDQLPAEA